MSVQVSCDVCGNTDPTIWGAFEYSPGGGRHGIERFHICFDCIPPVRQFMHSQVIAAPDRKRTASGRWMFFQDASKDATREVPA